MQTILVIDDEKNMCEVLKILLENEGYRVLTSDNGAEAIKVIEAENFSLDLIITDLKMPVLDGMELLNYLNNNQIQIPCIVISAYGSIETAVKAMKKGAVDFITKPFNKNIIKHTIKKIFHFQDIQQENQMLKSATAEKGIIYQSQVMKNIMETVKKVAQVPTPVLIIGESGTGKELIARAIHSFSQSEEGEESFKPFYGVNCPAIPESLFESELFGYRRGAFSGASEDFSGKIKLADRGILFLDEIG
ncbi:MAG: sigma 54-interacting transcriptional regulator, partial [Spirochaetes bacterium]|nr:sigma 54-interacting transcriptional regulator [Spirochaetota bacterium]